tara:strand:+ start:31123 stop:31794 length:672 start_codon:yes stop_codon:yes gene_type:complete
MAEPKKTNKKKYVRLASDNVMWRDEKSTVMLTSLQEGKSYIEVSTIPEGSLASIDTAVKEGLLVYMKDPKKMAESKTKAETRTPLVKSEKGSFKWKKDTKATGSTGKVVHTPSYSNRTMAYDSEDPIHQHAFKILSEAPQRVVPELTEVLTKIDEKEGKISLLKACMTIESNGHNPSMHPRTAVMEYLSDVLVDLGVQTGLNVIMSEESTPLVKDVKTLKFVA